MIEIGEHVTVSNDVLPVNRDNSISQIRSQLSEYAINIFNLNGAAVIESAEGIHGR